MGLLPAGRSPDQEGPGVHAAGRVAFVAAETVVRGFVEDFLAMVREVDQEAVRIAVGEALDQAGDHVVVVQHGVVVAVVDLHLVVAEGRRGALAVDEASVIGGIAVLVVHVGAEQMDHDEFLRRRVVQHLGEGRQHRAVQLAGVLAALVVQVELRIGLLGEGRQHGVALGHGLLVGDPEGLVAGLLHQVHQRRIGEEAVGMLLVSERQHLLQHLDGVWPRRHHVVEYREVPVRGLQCVQLRGRFAWIAVEAHVLARRGFADHQDQRARRIAIGIDEVLQRR